MSRSCHIFARLSLCAAITGVAMASLGSCDSLDDNRIPVAPVRIAFSSVGEWITYGVGGALDHRLFIRQQRIPSGFPYVAMSATGFGGIWLVCDFENQPRAYDAACPVECRDNVRITINNDDNVAICPVCHSTYDIFRYGAPLSGVAAQKGYGLTRYNVGPGAGGEYMLIRP